MRAALIALTTVGLALAPASGAAKSGPAPLATFAPLAGHRIAGFALDREWLAIAEDPATPGACPVVELVAATGGGARSLTRPGGPTCRLGGHFWVRPGDRAIGLAIIRAMWVVHDGTAAIAVKASPHEPETVLARAKSIRPVRGPFLGPVVATNWLRLFASYTRNADGTLNGKVVSGNGRTLWAATGPVLPLGLDDEEHAVAVGADGAIAMWHAHGARYGRVAAAHARGAAVDRGEVMILRSDRPQLDVRELSGRRIASWPVALGASPLLDADAGIAVYTAGRAVHELDLSTGHDRVVASAPPGTTLVDAQIERRLVTYAYRGGRSGAGRVVVIPR